MSGLLQLLREQRKVGENPVETFRRVLAQEAIAECDGNISAAARLIQVSPKTMFTWCADLRLRHKDIYRRLGQKHVSAT